MSHAIIERAAPLARRSSVDLRNIIDKLSAVGALGLALDVVELPEDESFTAETDGTKIRFGKRYFDLRADQRRFVYLHEIFHVALAHPLRGRRLRAADATYDHLTFNIACDAIINYAIASFKDVNPPNGGISIHDIERILDKPVRTWSCEQIYYALKASSSQKLAGYAKHQTVDVLEPGDHNAATGSDRSNRNDDRTIAGWQARLENAFGSFPTLAERLQGDIPKGTVPWRAIIRSFFGKALSGSNRISDPRRPHRRWSAMEPAFRNSGAPLPFVRASRPGPRPRVAVCVDTSGSIQNDLLNAFTGEISDILGKANAEVLLIVCDADVHQVIELRGSRDIAKLRRLTYQGGGGTDFVPAIDAARAWNPRALIYLTDLMGPAGNPPPFPVLWAVPTSEGPVSVPYGTLVRIAV